MNRLEELLEDVYENKHRRPEIAFGLMIFCLPLLFIYAIIFYFKK